MKRFILGLVALAAVSLWGCGLFGVKQNAGGKLQLVIPAITDRYSRSLGPAVDFYMTQFDIHGEGPNGETFDVPNHQSGNFEQSSVALGVWKITVKGKNKDGVDIGEGSAEIEVRPTSIARATIEIQPKAGSGTLVVDIPIQAGTFNRPKYMAVLRDGRGAETILDVSNDGRGVSISKALGSGFYTIFILIEDGEIPSWGIEEAVIILSGQETKAIYELSPINVNQPPSAPLFRTAERGVDGRVTLRWTDTSVIETGFVVQRMKDGDASFVDVASVRANMITYIDEGPFERGTSYRYRILADHPRGRSSTSAELTVQIPRRIEVNGKITGNQTWTAGNEYYIAGNVLIPKDVRVQVEAGASVLVKAADQGLYIKVEGILQTIGSPQAPVKINVENNKTWQGIKFTSLSVGSRLSYTEMSNGMISMESTVNIENSKFNNTSVSISGGGEYQFSKSDFNKGIYINSASIQMESCTIENNGGSALYASNSTVSLSKSLIRSSDTGISLGWGNGYLVMRSNVIKDNNIGVRFEGYSGSALVEQNEITNNSRAIYEYYYVYNQALNGNYIANNRQVFYFTDCYSAINSQFYNNIIVGNGPDSSIEIANGSNASLYSVAWTGNTIHNPEAINEVKLNSNIRGSGSILNLKGNFWGTSDLEEIGQRIYDSNDDFELYTVEYDPPAGQVALVANPQDPVSEKVVTTTAQTLKWNINGWASGYRVQVTPSQDFAEILYDRSDVTQMSILLEASALRGLFRSGNTYYWRVAAKDRSGVWAEFSTLGSFKVAIPVPVQEYPADQSRLYEGWNPLFRWSTKADLKSYRLEVSTSEAFSEKPVIDVIVADNQYLTPFILPEGTTYYWRIKGADSNETWGEWSAVRSFRIPLPGMGIELSDTLPKEVMLEIKGSTSIRVYATSQFNLESNITPAEVRWFVNGEEKAQGLNYYWYGLPRGNYTLTAMVLYQNRWYSTSTICTVLADSGY